MVFIINESAKVRTCVRHFPGLTSPVKEIGFTEVKEKSLTSVGFEPTTSGVDHQRSPVALVAQSVRALVICSRGRKPNFIYRASKPEEMSDASPHFGTLINYKYYFFELIECMLIKCVRRLQCSTCEM